MTKKIIVGLILAIMSITLFGCHTAEGFGEDVEGAGESIQGAVD
jgi:predicted small secreted protein